jgi:hypothetical protein
MKWRWRTPRGRKSEEYKSWVAQLSEHPPLRYVSDRLRDNAQIVTQALSSDLSSDNMMSRWSFKFASDRLRDNYDVVKAAITADCEYDYRDNGTQVKECNFFHYNGLHVSARLRHDASLANYASQLSWGEDQRHWEEDWQEHERRFYKWHGFYP